MRTVHTKYRIARNSQHQQAILPHFDMPLSELVQQTAQEWHAMLFTDIFIFPVLKILICDSECVIGMSRKKKRL